MMKKITRFFNKNYFDATFPLEYRIYMIFFFESFFLSIISATTNTLLQKGLFGIILQWSYILLCLIVMFIPIRLRLRIQKPLLIFITFVYIPFLFFQTAGFDGTALMFSLLGIFLLAIVFHGWQRIVVVAMDIGIYVLCSVTQYFHPEWIIPHGSLEAKVIDLIVALVLSAAGLAIMTVYVSNAFEIEKKCIRDLLKQLEKSNNTLAELTNRDALTGVYNRRYLTQFLERELETCDRTNNTICLLMFDLDNFKKMNDTYGHGFGDEVLIEFTREIQMKLRKYDILARYGGEEFVVVLHAIKMKDAIDISERARKAISELEFRNDVKVTVSIGLVESRHGESVTSIMNRADECMYKAKREGRNRVVIES